jgi:hypothetical protein
MCGDGKTYFTSSHRIKLLVDFLLDTEEDEGLGIDIEGLTEEAGGGEKMTKMH